MAKKQLFNRKPSNTNDASDNTEVPSEAGTVTVTEPKAPTPKQAGQRGRPKIPTIMTLTDGPKKVFDVSVKGENRRYKVDTPREITRAEVLSVAYKALAAGFTVTLANPEE